MLRCFGVLLRWYLFALMLWYFGALVLWYLAALLLCCFGVVMLRCFGASLRWCFGALYYTHIASARTSLRNRYPLKHTKSSARQPRAPTPQPKMAPMPRSAPRMMGGRRGARGTGGSGSGGAGTRGRSRGSAARAALGEGVWVQGCLAYKKTPTP